MVDKGTDRVNGTEWLLEETIGEMGDTLLLLNCRLDRAPMLLASSQPREEFG
jgi:hypothetical protein